MDTLGWSAAWIHGLDWGTVPAWASALLTSGSLLLGFYILLRDRRMEERQEAAQVICWLEQIAVLPDGRRSFMPRVANLAERTVSGVHLITEKNDEKALNSVEIECIAPFIRPGDEVSLGDGNEVTVFPHKVKRLIVTFLDADGTEWIRDLMSDLDGPYVFHPATLSGKHRWPFKHSRTTKNLTFEGDDLRVMVSGRTRRKALRRAR